CARSPFAYW
nr:immunoglobulin heavy chain junction region [Mus musculus]